MPKASPKSVKLDGGIAQVIYLAVPSIRGTKGEWAQLLEGARDFGALKVTGRKGQECKDVRREL